MPKAFVDPKRCEICSEYPALQICTAKAITQLESDSPPFIEARFCTTCGDCVAICSFGAITLQ